MSLSAQQLARAMEAEHKAETPIERQVATVQTEENDRFIFRLWTPADGKLFLSIGKQDKWFKQDWSNDPDQGIGFPADKIDDVIAALQRAKEMADEKMNPAT